jgi:hypothetical protein
MSIARPDVQPDAGIWSKPGVWEPEALPASFDFKKYQADSDQAVEAAQLGDLAGDDPPPIKTGGWNDTRNDVNADGKYLLLAVPEFKPGMTSYLRMGAACSTWESSLGHELEKMVHLVGPVGKSTSLPFIDDERARGGAAVHPGVGATVDESAVLHTKGGWRDHSDGNRITTTYGDKIEIIRGSYKMVVLGRQDAPADSAGWDLSGQHVQDWGYSMPGASVVLEWVPLYGGSWLQKNSTEIFHSWNRTAGNKRDEYWGDLLESYVGQEVPGESLPQQPPWPGGEPNPCMKNNPDIIEKTWAKSISTQTGSVVLPVPTIDDKTWVGASTETLNADSTSATATVTGSITESTSAASVTATTTVAGAITETTTAAAITGATTVGALTEVTTAGTITGVTTVGVMVDVTTAALSTELTLAPLKAELFVGGIHVDLYAAIATFEASLGKVFELNMSSRTKYTMFDETELNPVMDTEAKLEKQIACLGHTVMATIANVSAAQASIIAARVQLGIAPPPPPIPPPPLPV